MRPSGLIAASVLVDESAAITRRGVPVCTADGGASPREVAVNAVRARMSNADRGIGIVR
jgi:hypothetical protein